MKIISIIIAFFKRLLISPRDQYVATHTLSKQITAINEVKAKLVEENLHRVHKTFAELEALARLSRNGNNRCIRSFLRNPHKIYIKKITATL